MKYLICVGEEETVKLYHCKTAIGASISGRNNVSGKEWFFTHKKEFAERFDTYLEAVEEGKVVFKNLSFIVEPFQETVSYV